MEDASTPHFPRIAIYTDEATAERYEQKALDKCGVPYTKVTEIDILSGALENVDVLFLPGIFPFRRHGKGGMRAFFKSLRTLGGSLKDPILAYVEKGGGLIAVCGAVGILGKKIRFPFVPLPWGAWISCMGLFNYTAKYGSKIGVVTLKPRPGEMTSTILGRYSEHESFKTLYFRGPILYSTGDDVVVAEYVDNKRGMNGKGAVAYRPYGKGRIIACSVHPEFTTYDLFDSMISFVSRRSEAK